MAGLSDLRDGDAVPEDEGPGKVKLAFGDE